MTRLLIALSAAALVASPAVASNYVAKPATASDAKFATKDIRWTCSGDSCRGATELSRPVVLCQDLAKKAGRIESFLTDGRALGADDLAKCNKDAKGGSAVANAN